MRALALAALIAAAAVVGCARTPSPGTPNGDVASAPATAGGGATSNDASPMATERSNAPASTGIPGRTRPAPPMSKPLPPQVLPGGPDQPRIATGCRSDSDCAVKDIGSCCGVKPACINRNAEVDPAAVQAACEARGMMSACGFEAVRSCTCDAGTCRGNASDPVTP
jgi:hypothetical protein